jgi:hypothetical protein
MTNEVVYTSLARRDPDPVNRASSVIWSTGLASISTVVVNSLPRDEFGEALLKSGTSDNLPSLAPFSALDVIMVRKRISAQVLR